MHFIEKTRKTKNGLSIDMILSKRPNKSVQQLKVHKILIRSRKVNK